MVVVLPALANNFRGQLLPYPVVGGVLWLKFLNPGAPFTLNL